MSYDNSKYDRYGDENGNRDFSDRPSKDSSKSKGLCVEVRRNDVEKAISILKKKMAKEGVLRDLKRTEYFEKPSAKRRRKAAEAVSRWRKKERQLRDEW